MSVELRVALFYASFGALWILFSDRLLAGLVNDVATLSRLQTYKGWVFVAGSALLLFTLLRRELGLRRDAEGDLHESEERYRLLFEKSLDAILLTTAEGRILAANPAACRLFGRTEAELAQLELEQLLDPHEPSLPAVWERHGGFLGELVFLRKDGSRFPAEVSAAAFHDRQGQARTSLILRDSSARAEAERALRESERRYRLISENSADVIWTLDPLSGRFTYVSPSVFHLRGLTPEEVLARPMQDALTPAAYQFIVENLPARLRAFEGGDLSARTAITEVDQVRRDGSIVPTEVVTTLIPDANGKVVEILGVSRDISERRQAEEQSRRQLQYLNSLHLVDLAISSTFDLNVVLEVVLGQLALQLGVDAAVILLTAPPRGSLEYAASRGLGERAVRQLKSRAGHGRASQALSARRLIHSGGFQRDGADLKLGDESFADYFGVPLIAKGEVKGVLEVYQRAPLAASGEWLQFLEALGGQAAIAIDNAQLFRSLQHANLSLEQRVAERTAQLQQANAAKDEFLATMSHELRTPLNSILGLSESLLEQNPGPLTERQQKYLHTIQASGQHLFELINDILDLARIEAGQLEYQPQEVRVDELCESCLSYMREAAARKSISLSYENGSPVQQISADPRRLKQILINLLSNAIKFTPANGHVTLQVQADVAANRIRFSVSDDGLGIAAEDLPRLFRAFVQLDSSLSRAQGGTGLGLALVQRLTDLHGGSVDVESEPGQGSRFTVNLPLNLETRRPIPVPAAEAAPTRPREQAARRGTVLIAEDNPASLFVLEDYLASLGYNIVTSRNGTEALQKAGEANPEIILMDIQMPVMDGLEATVRLRRDQRFASTPIIALTALAMPGDRERCLQAGATAYLSKPVSLKELLETMESLLGNGS